MKYFARESEASSNNVQCVNVHAQWVTWEWMVKILIICDCFADDNHDYYKLGKRNYDIVTLISFALNTARTLS